MSSGSDERELPLRRSPPRTAVGRKPVGYRVLHVLVPERTFNHAKAQAYLSGIPFPEYVAKFLEEARPYPQPEIPPNGGQLHAS